jgi:hypothetical protein
MFPESKIKETFSKIKIISLIENKVKAESFTRFGFAIVKGNQNTHHLIAILLILASLLKNNDGKS